MGDYSLLGGEDHCGKWVRKRNLKVENFIRGNQQHLGFPRYYESCVLESKGSLALRNMIITSESILFTQHLPKSLLMRIDHVNILDVKLVADRHTLIKGGGPKDPCISQHVQLICSTKNPHPLMTSSTHLLNNNNNMEDTIDTFNSTSEKTRDEIPIITFSNTSSNPEDSTDYYELSSSLSSRQSSRMENNKDSRTPLPSSIVKMYEGKVTPLKKNKGMILRDTTSRSLNNSPAFSSTSSSPIPLLRQSRISSRRKKKAGEIETELIKSPASGSGGSISNPRRPRSLDPSQLSSILRRKVTGLFNNNNNEVKEEDETNDDDGIDKEESRKKKDERDDKVEYINFYLYIPNSIALHELLLFWNRRKLNSILVEEEERNRKPKSNKSRRSKKYKEKEKTFLYLLQGLKSLQSSSTLLLKNLIKVDKLMEEYGNIGRSCWKDFGIIKILENILVRCTTTPPGRDDEDSDEDILLDKMYTITILFHTFRVLYESLGPSEMLNPHLELSLTLTKLIFHMKVPKVENGVIWNPRRYCEGQWIHSRDSKVVTGLILVHNSSVSLLHEIFSLFQFPMMNCNRAKFMEGIGTLEMENYLKLSMTQVINLLWNNHRYDHLSPWGTVMLYRHLSVVQTLIGNVPRVKGILRDHFSEEFRYFVHEESANRRVVDEFPLKSRLVEMCHQLRHDIIDK